MPMPEDRLTSAFGRSTREANMSEDKSATEKYRAVLVDALRAAEFRRRFVADPEAVTAEQERKRVVWGMSGQVSVELGGRRGMKKNKKQDKANRHEAERITKQ